MDAFTDRPFGGNPAGVVTDADGLTDAQMQSIAREMNLSETAFVMNCQDGSADFHVRFFTPAVEVDLCGHATIATFFTLSEDGRLADDGPRRRAQQKTRAGVLPVDVYLRDGRTSLVMMAQATPSFRGVEVDGELLSRCLGVPRGEIESTGMPVQLAFTGIWHLVVPVPRLERLVGLRPDFLLLRTLNESLRVVTTHVFTLETLAPGATAHARDFAPAAGVYEDPVTGTANGALGAYLVHNGIVRSAGDVTVVVEQGHAVGRPGRVTVEVAGREKSVLGVRVGGCAVTVLDGMMYL